MQDTVMSNALKEAGLSRYANVIWKGEKRKEGDKYVQDSKRIIDMDETELRKCYKHCDRMLWNEDPKHLGRFNVLDEVSEQIKCCNIELLLRYCENAYMQDETRGDIKRYSLMISLRELMHKNPEIEDWSKVPISRITENLPSEFQDISIADVLKGCTNNLGAFNKEHLTMTFITKMGLWFTKQEESELKAQSNIERLKIAKERLRLPSKLVLRISEKGLSFKEMRAMLMLPKKQRYSDMTTEQLVTLRNKVLLRYQMEVDNHIWNWQRLQKQIVAIAEEKGITID